MQPPNWVGALPGAPGRTGLVPTVASDFPQAGTPRLAPGLGRDRYRRGVEQVEDARDSRKQLR
jgi:hypothetical protein